ncbi:MAG: hypothetical protein Q8N23_34180 [Archangium sp.]|nr:hypothetical protein [Archangium sp.]MDP3157769.1 hypothetical protein [Archangium sp.]MDP3575288.1 hypothetical protein [Archangium sp.]
MAPELRRFILTSIPSVPYLEAVLLLRAEAGRGWSAADVARRLYLPEQQAADLLENLQGAGLTRADPDGAARYAPSTDELASMIAALAARYTVDVVGVSDLIHSRGERKAQQFADAFLWKKDS